jgi:hydroxypyruvate isomerase
MLTYAPNISWLFPDLPFAERPRAVAGLGFRALEFGFPSHADIDALAAGREEFGLDVILFNQDVPVWDAANRGYLVDPARRDEFRRTLDGALAVAERLRVRKVMLPAGVVVPGMDRQAQRACMVENLRAAAPLAGQAGVLLTIEALNPFDNPGYFLTGSREALDIVREVGHPHVRFQFDTYHLQLMEGNLTRTLRDNVSAIGHIQFADVPGRHEPGTGEINFANLARFAEEAGYEGFIGLEYIPLARGAAALAWCMPGS